MRYFNTEIFGDLYLSTFSVEYNLTSSATYQTATLAGTTTPATGLTYSSLTTGDGVTVQVPDGVNFLKISDDDNICPDISQSFGTAPIFETSGDNDFYLTVGFNSQYASCYSSYYADNPVTSDATSISTGMGEYVYQFGTYFNGQNKWYEVSSTERYFYNNNVYNWYWQISTTGEITATSYFSCQENP